MPEPDENGIVSPDYTYRARIVSIYDGDTVTVDIDLGFGVWMKKQKLRLFGINAPEMRGPEKDQGRISRDALRQMCPIGSDIIVATKSDKKGKYGRWLADIWYSPTFDTEGPMMSANDTLVQRGLAKRAFYR